MLRTIVIGLLAASALAVVPGTAEACRCGRSHISPKKVCHKSPCDCPYCDHRDSAAPPTAKTVVAAAKAKTQAPRSK